jgi:hypothetical protein
VVSGTGIGDVDELLSTDGTGVLVTEFGDDHYRAAAIWMAELIADDGTPARCRALAHRELSLEDVGIARYDRMYRRLAG